jgi:hypothetical protein
MALACGCFACVRETEVAIIENCGSYSRLAPAGCSVIQCPFENIVGYMSLRVQQLNVTCDTKTKVGSGYKNLLVLVLAPLCFYLY